MTKGFISVKAKEENTQMNINRIVTHFYSFTFLLKCLSKQIISQTLEWKILMRKEKRIHMYEKFIYEFGAWTF